MKYLGRNIDAYLYDWKLESDRKPLLVRGARQVGKSWAIRHLAESFENFIEINLESRKDILPLFAEATDVKKLTRQISLIFGIPIIEGKTLLFIDEIQFSLGAISLLRYFREEMPGLHVIAAGSLLEFALEEIPSFGVGRISSVFMYPFSFTEYLKAIGKQDWVEEISTSSYKSPIFGALHDKIVEEFRDFMLVGGMPACVAKWAETKDYLKCSVIQDEILQSYYDDFGKYAKKIDPGALRATLQSVIQQQGAKFVYSKVEGAYREEIIKESLRRLTQAGLIQPVKMTSANGLPLGAQVNSKFTKYLYLDTGLMLRALDMDFGMDEVKKTAILGTSSELVNKGSMAEMFVGWELIKSGNHRLKHDLYYWENLAKGASAEVDFVMPYNMQVLPIEVKSGTSGKMKSLRLFMESKHLSIAIRTSLENFAELSLPNDSKILIVPLYAISRYRTILGSYPA